MRLNILNRDSNTDRIIEIPGDEILIGKNLECDLVLEGDGIDAHHVRIVRIDGQYFLKSRKDAYGDIQAAYKPMPGVVPQGIDRDGLIEHSEFATLSVGPYTISIADT